MSSAMVQRKKIGYFNLVTRALDDRELKTCKQCSRALGVLELLILTHEFDKIYLQPTQPVVLWKMINQVLTGVNHAVDHLHLNLRERARERKRGHSWTLMLHGVERVAAIMRSSFRMTRNWKLKLNLTYLVENGSPTEAKDPHLTLINRVIFL